MPKIVTPTTAYDDGIVILQPYPYYLNGKAHSGIDIYSQQYRGHRPRATEDGIVVEVVAGSPKQVSRVVIEVASTGDRIEYKHVKTRIKQGTKVVGGDIIGEYDDSGSGVGLWQGYHLHFGYREIPKYELGDPVYYFLSRWPEIIFYMRDNVKAAYKERKYYELMNIKPIPWEEK